jgi:hypothetical protein
MTQWIATSEAWAHVVLYEGEKARVKIFAKLVEGKLSAYADFYTFNNAEHRNSEMPQAFWDIQWTRLDFASGKATRAVFDIFASIDARGERVVRQRSSDDTNDTVKIPCWDESPSHASSWRHETRSYHRAISRWIGGAKTLARGTDTSAGQFRKLLRAEGEPEAKMIGDAAACSPCGSGAGRRWSGPRPSGAIADVRISNRRSLPRMTSGAGGRRAVSALRADRPATFQH